MIKALSSGRQISIDRGSRKLLIELAQTFIEQTLDLNQSEKHSPSISALQRQLRTKFPEIVREVSGVGIDHLQRRGIEIEKE